MTISSAKNSVLWRASSFPLPQPEQETLWTYLREYRFVAQLSAVAGRRVHTAVVVLAAVGVFVTAPAMYLWGSQARSRVLFLPQHLMSTCDIAQQQVHMELSVFLLLYTENFASVSLVSALFLQSLLLVMPVSLLLYRQLRQYYWRAAG